MPFSVELSCRQTRTRSPVETAMPSMTCVDESVRLVVEATMQGALTATEVVRPCKRSVTVEGMSVYLSGLLVAEMFDDFHRESGNGVEGEVHVFARYTL